jgi:cobalamin biosynthesis protein CobT
MRSDLLQHELARTSAVFGRKHDVRVVFRADLALTDGSTIILPSMGYGRTVDEETAAVMRGFVDHEAGHVRHTDFKALKTWREAWSARGDTLAPKIANALEDIWLERRVMSEYPGAEANLLTTSNAVNRKFLARVARGEVSEAQLAEPRAIAAVAITWQGRLGYGGLTQAECLALLRSAWLRSRLPVWVAGIGAGRNTAAVCRLADRIAREIENERAERERVHEEERRRREEAAEEEPDAGEGERGDDEAAAAGPEDGDPAGGAGEPCSGGDEPAEAEDAEGEGAAAAGAPPASEGEDTGAGEGASTKEVDDNGPGAEGAGAESAEDADEPAASGSTGSESGAAEGPDAARKAPCPLSRPATVDPLDVPDAAEVLRDALDAGGLLAGYRAFSTEHDRWHHRSQASPHAELMRGRDAGHYDRLLAGMTGEVNAMRRALERMLLAQEHRDWEHAREAGRLDARRFPAVVAGHCNVFKTRQDRSGLDTAVTILVDLSGSMHGSRAIAARDCVMALCEALTRTTVTCEVLGFSNSEMIPGVHEAARAGGMGAYARIETLDMWIFKAFHERLFEAKGAIASLDEYAGGDNTDGEALWRAYLRLRDRPEKRKVMLVLSDGEPCAMTFSDDHRVFEAHLREVLARVEGEGRVECVGLGIQSSAVADFYRRWVCVDDVAQLATEGVGLLAEVLLGRGRRAA